MTSKAEKLLEGMRRSSANWKRRDLETLLIAYGFELRHGGNHDTFKHVEYPELRIVLPRHGKIKNVYIKKAVKLIDKLLQMQDTDKLGS